MAITFQKWKLMILVVALLMKDCQASSFKPTMAVDGTTTSSEAVVIISTSETDVTSLDSAVVTCNPACSDVTYDNDGVALEVKATIGELTSSTLYTISAATVTKSGTSTKTVDNPDDVTTCTMPGDLDLKVDTTSATSIKVTWTKEDGEGQPTMYKLFVDDVEITEVPASGDAEYTFEAKDATGTALEEGVEYTCKITGEIAAFGGSGTDCPAATAMSEVACKAEKSGAIAMILSNTALLALLFSKLFV